MTTDFYPIIIEFYPYPLLAGIAALIVLLFVARRKKRGLARLFCISLFWVYILIALDLLFFPVYLPKEWPGNVTGPNILGQLGHVNLIPGNYGDLFTMNTNIILGELGGNILLTVPLGFLLPLLVHIPPRRVFALALLTGLALETTQLVISLCGLVAGHGHSVDINDVLLNALGVLVGYGLLRFFYGGFLCIMDKRTRLSVSAPEPSAFHELGVDIECNQSRASISTGKRSPTRQGEPE